MTVTETELPGVLLIAPKVFGDSRGFFLESYNYGRYRSLGIDCEFVQDNISYSHAGVLRGLHYQLPTAQAKLVQVLDGAILDVAVDIRVGSPTFGKWVGAELTSENRHQLYIPPQFAHGFVVTGTHALVSYKCSAPYDPTGEGTVLWNDPVLGIAWNCENPIVSDKDQAGKRLADVPLDRLPSFNNS